MKGTKKTLLVSILSLVLCVAMLLGTTYAWFTDSVQSGVNTIVAGNLDVELYHQNKTVTTPTKVTKDTDNLFKDVAKWEPGAYAYETFTVKNEGDLALKYSMSLNVSNITSDNGHDLTDVLKVKVVETAPASRPAYTDGIALKDWQLNEVERPLYPKVASGEQPTDKPCEKTFTVVVYWEPSENDNLYNMNNGKETVLSLDLGVNLVATQLQYESDSFGIDYDKNAPLEVAFKPMNKPLPTGESLKIKEQGALKEAIVPGEAANGLFDALKDNDATSNDLTIKLNVEEKGSTETSVNFEIDMTAIMKSTKSDGSTTESKTDVHELADFAEIKLNVGAGRLNLTAKHDGNPMTKVANKAAIASTAVNEDGYFSYDEATGDVIIWTKKLSPFSFGFELPKSDEELLKENPNYTCRIGNKGYERPFQYQNKNYQCIKGSALDEAKSGDTITLIADVDLSKAENYNAFAAITKPSDFEVTIDLNGKTVTVPTKVQLNAGVYNIIDTSEAGNGKITRLDLYNNQDRLNTITANISGGNFDVVATDGDHGDKTLNVTGGTIRAIEVQDSEKAGQEGTPQHRDAIEKVSISGGKVQYVSIWWSLDVADVVTCSNGYSLGDEITGQPKTDLGFTSSSYKLYPVVCPQ